MAEFALAADDFAQALQLPGLALIQADDLVERVANFPFHAGAINGQADREIADAHQLQRVQQMQIEGVAVDRWRRMPIRAPRRYRLVRYRGAGMALGGDLDETVSRGLHVRLL